MNPKQAVSADSTARSEPDPSVVRRCVRGAMVGNAIEWFDYGAYGYVAVYIAQVFFSDELLGVSSDSALPLILTLATFAISFLVRPLGGMVLGPIGDRIGRQRVLVGTVVGISAATALIGLLPTAQSVGVWAPILLVLCRMAQGFAAGGEYSAASNFLSEHAPDRRRGFYVAFLDVGTWVGLTVAALLCTGLAHAIGNQGMLDGGWRVPFLVSIPLGLLGLLLRSRLTESDIFLESQATRRPESGVKQPNPIVVLVTKYPKQLLQAAAFTITLNVSIYMVIGYLPSFLADDGHSELTMSYGLVVAQVLICVVLVPFGALSDRIGRKPLLVIASAWFILFSVPAFMLVNASSLILQFVGILLVGAPMAVFAALTAATLAALFPTSVRNSGFAISYNVSTALFGGTAPALSVWLVDLTGNALIPGWYLVVVGIVGLVAVLTFVETAGVSIRGEGIPGDTKALSPAGDVTSQQV